MLESLLDWLFPPLCPGCGRVGGVDFCTDCEGRMPRLPLMQVHSVCLAAAAPYDGPMRSAILALKAGGRVALARPIALRMARAGRGPARRLALDAVAEVPADGARLRRRGYHVPSLLAGEVARLLGIPHRPHLLGCRGPLPGQRGLSRERRLENLRGRFRASPARGLRVLLVDDVVTTGATIREGARTLREAGAAEVMALAAGVSEMLTPFGWPDPGPGSTIVQTPS